MCRCENALDGWALAHIGSLAQDARLPQLWHMLVWRVVFMINSNLALFHLYLAQSCLDWT